MPTKNLAHLVGEPGVHCLAHWREASDTSGSSLGPDQDKLLPSNTTAAQEEVCLASQTSHEVIVKPQDATAANAGDNQPAHDISQQLPTLSLCSDLLSMLGPDLVEASLAHVVSHGGNTSSSQDRLVGPSSTAHNHTQSEADSKVTDITPARRASGSSNKTPNKRKRSEPHEPLGTRPASRTKHQQVPSPKTISFEDVYQNGNASVKHRIVQFPDKTGKWYIILCREHGVYFKGNPFLGAGSHLTSKMHKARSREPAHIIRHLGVQVIDCTQELAEKNNTSVLRAYRNGYQHPSSQDASPEAEQNHQPRRPRGARDQGGRSRRQLKHGPGITEPIPGEVYLAYWAMSKDWSAILLLPNAGLDKLGISGSLESLGLMESVPECYEHGEGRILGWKDGYEPDGKLVSRRQFPVMYFDGQEFPERSAVGWAMATDLQPFDVEAANESLIPHYKSVREFLREREERNAGSPSREIQVGPNIGFTVEAEYDGSEEELSSSTPPSPSDDYDFQDDSMVDLHGQALRERAEDWNPSDISDICSSDEEEMEDVSYSSSARFENVKSSNNGLVTSKNQVTEISDDDVPMPDVLILDSDQSTARPLEQKVCSLPAQEVVFSTPTASCSAVGETPLPPRVRRAVSLPVRAFHSNPESPTSFLVAQEAKEVANARSTPESPPPLTTREVSPPMMDILRSTIEEVPFSPLMQQVACSPAVATPRSTPNKTPSPATPEALSPAPVSVTCLTPGTTFYPAPRETSPPTAPTTASPNREESASFGVRECTSGFQASPSFGVETPRLETDEDSVFDSDVLEAPVPVRALGFRIEQHITNTEQSTPTRSRLHSVSTETSMTVAGISQLETRQYKEPPPSSFVASSVACLAQKVFETMQQNQYASHHGPSEHCGAGGVTSDAVRTTGAGTASGALQAGIPRNRPTSHCTSTATLPSNVCQPVSPAVQAAPVSYYNPSAPPSASHSYVRVEPRAAQTSPRLQLAPIRTPFTHHSSMPNSLMKHSIMQHSIMQPLPIPPQRLPTQNLPEPVSTSQKLAPMNSPLSAGAPFQVPPIDRPMPIHPSLGGSFPSQLDVQIINNPSGPEYPASPLPPMVTPHEENLPPADIPLLNWGSETVSSSPSLAFINSSNSPPQAQAQVQAQAQTRTNKSKIKSKSKARTRAKVQAQTQGQGQAHHHPQGQAQAHPHYHQSQVHGYAQPQPHVVQAAFVAVPSQNVIMAQIKEQSLQSDDEIFPTGLAENPMKGRRRNFKPLFVWPDDVPPALVDFCVRHLQSRGLHPGPVGFANDFVSYNCHFCSDAKGWYVAGAFLRHLKRRHGPGCDKAII